MNNVSTFIKGKVIKTTTATKIIIAFQEWKECIRNEPSIGTYDSSDDSDENLSVLIPDS